MAYSSIGKPGTEFGPCAESCNHADCNQLRVLANTPCRICGIPIGYEANFQQERDAAPVHIVCAWAESEDIDDERAGR